MPRALKALRDAQADNVIGDKVWFTMVERDFDVRRKAISDLKQNDAIDQGLFLGYAAACDWPKSTEQVKSASEAYHHDYEEIGLAIIATKFPAADPQVEGPKMEGVANGVGGVHLSSQTIGFRCTYLLQLFTRL